MDTYFGFLLFIMLTSVALLIAAGTAFLLFGMWRAIRDSR